MARAQEEGVPTSVSRRIDIHISPVGRPGAPGTPELPVGTIGQAQDLLKRRRAGRLLPATLWLHPGVYAVTDTVALSEEDSGEVVGTLEIRASAPGTARLTGANTVSAGAFRKITDRRILARLPEPARGHVVQLDLAALGIQHVGPFPDLFRGQGGILELLWRGRRMPLARWPNEGYTTIERVLDSGVWGGDNMRGGTFRYRGERPGRWLLAVREGLWLKGFWRVPWQPDTVRVAAIDPAERTITHACRVGGGLGSKYSKEVNGTRPGNGKENWYALNLLEELDRPGEWCIRFQTDALYFWPPGPLSDGDVLLSDLDQPLVQLSNVSQLTVSGLVFDAGLGDGVVIEGGTNILIAGCELRNMGGTAVVIKGGTDHVVQSCDIHDTGGGGVYVGGGDRKTLTPAWHEVINNDIWRTGQVQTTYAPAVTLGAYGIDAVGCRVVNNRMHDLPHAAVLYGGNDNLLELNEVYRVALDSGDVGAFYTWHDWTSRGNVLRHNYVHSSPGCNAFYMDDGDSGDTIEGNIIWGTHYGPFIGGGHDNIVRHNVIIACARGLHVDSRGIVRGYTAANRHLMGLLKAVDTASPPWSERYPELVGIMEDHPDWPTGTVLERNLLIGCESPIHIKLAPDVMKTCRIGDSTVMTREEAGLVESSPFTLTAAEVDRLAAHVKAQIPFAGIGLQVDSYRKRVCPPSQQPRSASATEVFDSAVDVRASDQAHPQR